MPKFYYERTAHRYVMEYHEIEAADEDEAEDFFYNGDSKCLGYVIGDCIDWIDNSDTRITADKLPDVYDAK